MDRETSCLSCHGTGTILSPFDPRPGQLAHTYSVVCGCGVFLERNKLLLAESYQTGQMLPWKHHKQALARAAGFVAWADEPLVTDIERLWAAGIETFSSCQGGVSGYPDKFILIRDPARAAEAMGLLPWAVTVKDRGDDAALYASERPA